MSAIEGQERRAEKKSSLLDRLHNPTELRLCLMAVTLGIGYAAVFLPLNRTIAATTRKLADAQKRLDLAAEVEVLRKQFRSVQSRIPDNGDTSEWMQYVLGGLRQSPLQLESFTPGPSQALGSYQVLSIKIKASGSFEDLDKFIYWLESNPRLFRVDNLKLSPGGGGAGGGAGEAGDISMEIAVSGVIS
jgi:Tfp pilus assembly protein PilO